MNRFVSIAVKILIFIVLVISADTVTGYVLRKLYFKQTSGQNRSMTYVLSECTEDVLILGNSRAQYHYDPRVIGKELNMSCFNAGQGGGHSILLPYSQLEVLTKRYSPKIVILEFFTEGIIRYRGDYDRLSILLPYYRDYPEVRPLVMLRSPFEKVKILSSVYPFNSNILNIVRFNINVLAKKKQDFDGYIPRTGKVTDEMLKAEAETTGESVIDPNKVKALEEIIRICREKNINLFIVTAPVFHYPGDKKINPSPASRLSLEIMERNHVNYLDFTYDPAFIGQRELFFDIRHLNDVGSKIFSKILADTIKQRLVPAIN
jgi:hypothetical protein